MKRNIILFTLILKGLGNIDPSRYGCIFFQFFCLLGAVRSFVIAYDTEFGKSAGFKRGAPVFHMAAA